MKFKAIHVDNDAKHTHGSVMRLWTHQNKKIFNILHIHIDD